SPTPRRPETRGLVKGGPPTGAADPLGMAASKPTPQRTLRIPFPSQWVEIWGPYSVVWAVSLSTKDLCTQSLTTTCRIGRFSGLGRRLTPCVLPKSSLPRRPVPPCGCHPSGNPLVGGEKPPGVPK